MALESQANLGRSRLGQRSVMHVTVRIASRPVLTRCPDPMEFRALPLDGGAGESVAGRSMEPFAIA